MSSPSGTTGAYISLSCYYEGAAPKTPVPVLSGLAVADGQGFSVEGAGCSDSIDIVSSSPALSGITNGLLSNWECSVHEAFDSRPASFGVLAIDTSTGAAYEAADGTHGDPYILAFPGGNVEKPSEQLGGSNPSEHPTQCNAGDPVDCATGDFWQTFSDVSVPGPGPALQLTRTYNSLAASSEGPFGYGWSDSYGMSLSVGSGGQVTVTQENGSTVSFTPGPAPGSFSAPPRVMAALVQNADGSYTFTRHQTQVFDFSPSGRLESESDPDGYTTPLAYNASGQLATVTGPSGRAISFAYGPGGLVSSVTGPMGRTTTYTYDTAATSPRSQTLWAAPRALPTAPTTCC